MNKKEIPQSVLNKRKYNKERYDSIGYRGFTINLSIEQFNEIDKYLKENNLTREGFVKKIIEKYK